MNEAAWMVRASDLLNQLGEHLRQARTANEHGHAELRDAALQAAKATHAELGAVLREGDSYLRGVSLLAVRRSRNLSHGGADGVH